MKRANIISHSPAVFSYSHCLHTSPTYRNRAFYLPLICYHSSSSDQPSDSRPCCLPACLPVCLPGCLPASRYNKPIHEYLKTSTLFTRTYRPHKHMRSMQKVRDCVGRRTTVEIRHTIKF